jgi:hypothetical protein
MSTSLIVALLLEKCQLNRGGSFKEIELSWLSLTADFTDQYDLPGVSLFGLAEKGTKTPASGV